LFLIVGNSGAGKDSLLALLAQEAGARLALTFPQRWITRRQADDHEAYRAVESGEFARKLKAGDFSVWWEAYGYFYGIGKELDLLLAAGRNVVVNVSRQVVGELRRRYPNTVVILIDAPPELIARRLEGRRRSGDDAETGRRLARATTLATSPDWDVAVRNDGDLAQGGRRLVAAVEAALASRPVLEVVVLGTSASYPAADSANSSFLVRHAEASLLVDAPPSLPQLFVAHRLHPADLRGVVITHDHADHFLGLGALLQSFREEEFALPLFAPAQALGTIAAYLRSLRLGLDLGRKVKLLPVRLSGGAAILSFPGLLVTGSPAAHSRATITVSVKDRGTGKMAVFSSDTRPSSQLVAFATRADLLFHDCAGLDRHRDRFSRNHSSSRQAGRVACLAGARQLVLTHLDARYFSSPEELVAEAREEFAGPVSVARSGQVYCVAQAADQAIRMEVNG
jgi:phosphonate metabolism protein PhnN/1,5-bisphosphokinase (PRPP-forming)